MITTPANKLTEYQQAGHWDERRLHDLYYRTADQFPDRIAIVDPADKATLTNTEPNRLTYAELADQTDKLAMVLLEFGITKDDIVLVQMPNTIELAMVYLAASKIGVIISPIAVQYQEHELSHIVKVLDPKAVISVSNLKGADFTSHIKATFEHVDGLTHEPLHFVWGIENNSTDVVNLDRIISECQTTALLDEYCTNTTISSADVLTICWTSGTEGFPKGIPRSHAQWIAIGKVAYDGNKIVDGEALLNPFPFINMGAIGGLFLSWLFSGGKLVLHHPMDLPVFLTQIVDEQISYTLAPPALLNAILKNEQLLAACDLSSIRAIGSGSAPLDDWMVAAYKDQFDIEIINHYGSNEGASLLCGPNETNDPEHRARLFPRGSQFMQSRLSDLDSGELVDTPGVKGELQVTGPGVFDCYYKNPVKTAGSFTDDGYFCTGDVFEIDSDNPQFYRFVGRCKDLIMRGGVNIAPAELDNLISGHDLVEEAAVAAYACDVMGERVAAFIVPKSGHSIDLQGLVKYLQQHKLAKYKLPEKLILIDAIPRNPLGKVLRQQLTDMI